MRLHLDSARHFAPFILILGLLFPSSSCKSPVVPPDDWPPTGPDATSHNFTWQIDTIGVSGILYDVAIINDTLAYAVGEIYLNDSTGQIDPQVYGVARWDGSSWIPQRVYYNGSNLIAPIRGIFALGANDVWLAAGSIFHWDGSSSQTTLEFSRLTLPDPNATIEKIWANSGSNIYGVGNAGTIVYFDGSLWQKIESGRSNASFRFTDVWGLSDNGSTFVLCVGSDFAQEHAVMFLSPLSATDSLGWVFQSVPNSVWFSIGSPYYVGGSGIWRYDESWERVDSTESFNRIRGNSANDVFAWGGGIETSLKHYNGSTWHEYPEIAISPGFRSGLAVQGSKVIAVGFVGGIPFAIRGTR